MISTKLLTHQVGISFKDLKLQRMKSITRLRSNSSKTISQSLLQDNLEKQEEKYQIRLSRIIEIFYSQDESFRPSKMKPIDIDYMVKMEKSIQIKNYMRRLARMEALAISTAEHKQVVREAILSKPKPEFGIVFDKETGSPVYKFHCNNLICSWALTKRIREHKYARMARSKLLDPPKVIIDFDYDHHMTVKQHMTITAQVKRCFGIMKELDEPINLYFCNLKPESPVSRYLEIDFGSISSHLIEVTSKSYLDLFPKEKLVYLTADTENVLQYDPDDIYIIGGMIDTLTNEPLSALKSRREGLRTAKLPLNEYFHIRNEIKSLKIGQVFGIISELSSSGNVSLRKLIEKYIPQRIQPSDETELFMEKFETTFSKAKQSLQKKFLLTNEETEIMLLTALYHGQKTR